MNLREIVSKVVVWTELDQDRIERQSFMKTIMNLRMSYKKGNPPPSLGARNPMDSLPGRSYVI
jgi:hypothetical protein